MSTRTATDLLANLTTHELFAVHGALQEELKRREITRTANIVQGIGEYLGNGMYGGTRFHTAANGMVLTDPQGRRFQIKARTAGGPDHRRSFPVDPSGHFDFHVFLMLKPETFQPVMARCLTRERVRELLKSEKRLSLATVRKEGDDVLAEAVESWQFAGHGM
jgi:hypothetical protein